MNEQNKENSEEHELRTTW